MYYPRYTQGFRKLIAWKEAHALTLAMYKTTMHFPSEERFGIISQLRRASSSIAAQIAEGSQMQTSAHRKTFYDRAYASATEVDYFLELSKDLGFVSEDTYRKLLEQVSKTCFLVLKLAKSELPTPPTKPN